MNSLIVAGPDPEGARPRLERFIEQGGEVPADSEGRRLLAAVLGNGSFLADIILSDVGQFARLRADPWLTTAKPRADIVADTEAATRDVTTEADLKRQLRLVRRREMLRLGARELGWGSTLEVARELSALADGCLEAAVAFWQRQLSATNGPPTSPDGTPQFVVLAMGKLGGEELNFSSDVDLIYMYSTDEGHAGTLTLHEYFCRLSTGVTRALADITADGLVFRVDLRLRPEGRSGAVCNSLAAAESYYETFGRTWERQALLRARPCAGDAQLGAAVLKTLQPFIHPRSVGPQAIEDVRTLRRLFRETTLVGAGFNVKLGEGGIRDVELVAQLLQLLHAGSRPELRERSTLPALRKLAVAGLLSDQEEKALASAYRFWRRVEHRIQVQEGAQTHELPADGPGLALMGRRLGFSQVADFQATMDLHKQAVMQISDTLGEPEQGPSALVLQLLDAASTRAQRETRLRAARFVNIEDSANALDLAQGRLPAAWLEEAITSPDPDRALYRFCDLSSRGSLGVFALLRNQPSLLRMLASLFGTSDRLSRHLLSHPGMWEPLVDRLGAPHPPASQWQRELPERLDGLDFEEALRETRRYQAEEILRIGLHDVAGNLEPQDVSRQLSSLAEACLRAAVQACLPVMTARFGLPDATLTVLALGSLGAREMRYGSDLDLVFLYSHPGTTSTGIDYQEWFARLAQRAIGALTALLDEGRLYQVDTRLRPSGAQGLLVTSYEAFDHYHQDTAAPWERMALLRARPIFTSNWVPGARETDFAQRLAEITYARSLDPEFLRNELLRVRSRIDEERGQEQGGAVHLRLSAGGLTDLEFIAALAQLRHGGTDPGFRTTSPLLALQHLADRDGLGPTAGALLQDYRFLQRAALRLRLLRDRTDDWLAPADMGLLARSLGDTEEGLGNRVSRTMARVRQAFMQQTTPVSGV